VLAESVLLIGLGGAAGMGLAALVLPAMARKRWACCRRRADADLADGLA
jgi:hypothetical protein